MEIEREKDELERRRRDTRRKREYWRKEEYRRRQKGER